MKTDIREILKAYLDCMNYIRKCKNIEEFNAFHDKMKNQIESLKKESDQLGLAWIMKAREYYRKINGF